MRVAIDIRNPAQIGGVCSASQRQTAGLRARARAAETTADGAPVVTDRELLLQVLENQEAILLAVTSNLVARADMAEQRIAGPPLIVGGRG